MFLSTMWFMYCVHQEEHRSLGDSRSCGHCSWCTTLQWPPVEISHSEEVCSPSVGFSRDTTVSTIRMCFFGMDAVYWSRQRKVFWHLTLLLFVDWNHISLFPVMGELMSLWSCEKIVSTNVHVLYLCRYCTNYLKLFPSNHLKPFPSNCTLIYMYIYIYIYISVHGKKC